MDDRTNATGGDEPTEEPLGAVRDPALEIRRLRRRQRVLGGLAVAVAVAGPVLGAAIERRWADDGAVHATSAGDSAAEEATDTRAGDDPAGQGAADGTTQPADTDSVTAAGAADRAVAASGYAMGPILEWIGSASVGDLDVRLLVADYGTPDHGNPFWDPPPGCFATGSYSIQVSTSRFAAVTGVERYGIPGRPDGTVQLLGVAEGDPRWVVVAAVDPAGATVTFPDGQVGSAVDIGGLTVASAPAPEWAEADHDETGHSATIETGGEVLEVSSWPHGSEQFHAENCAPPPPSLPEPGEQPADAAEATESVREAISTVFGNPDPEAKAAVLEHPDVVITAMEDLAQNYPGISSTAEMGDLVFTAPDTAFFFYDLVASDIADFDDQIGEARLVDGRWVISTESVCQQLRKGGVACEVPAN